MTVRRRLFCLAAAAAAVAGCEDMGLRGAELAPLEDAAALATTFPTVAADADVQAGLSSAMVRLGRQAWVATAEVIDLPRGDIRSVGAAEGRVFSAPRWDAAPYDRLLVATRDGRWQVYLPVIGVDPARPREDVLAPAGGAAAGGTDAHTEEAGEAH
jgi:hypothetical protein